MASCQKSDAWRLVCQRHVWHSWWLWFLVGFNFVFMFNFELEAQAKYKWSFLTLLRQWVLEILDELQQMQVRKNSFIYNIASWPFMKPLQKSATCHIDLGPFLRRCVWTAGHHSVRQVESWSPLGKCLGTLSWTAGRTGWTFRHGKDWGVETTTDYNWVFPKIVVPPNHPFW